MKEELFWGTIEMAWQTAGGAHATRQQLARGGETWNERIERLLDKVLPNVVEALRSALENAEREELLDFARILGERLRALDLPEVLRRSGAEEGEGFLYARSFIVILGRDFYAAVAADPAILMSGLQCEELWDMPAAVYEGRFGMAAPSVEHSVEEWPAEDETDAADAVVAEGEELFDEDEEFESDWTGLRDNRDVSNFSLPEENHPPKAEEI